MIRAKLTILSNRNKIIRTEEITGEDCQEIETKVALRHYTLPIGEWNGNLEYVEGRPKFTVDSINATRHRIQWGIKLPPECEVVLVGTRADLVNFLTQKGFNEYS